MSLADLVNTATKEVRGQTFTFQEIGSEDWINHVMQDAPAEHRSAAEVTRDGRDFWVRCIACSMVSEQSVEALIEELTPLPEVVLQALYAPVDELNGLTALAEQSQGKDTRAVDTPAS